MITEREVIAYVLGAMTYNTSKLTKNDIDIFLKGIAKEFDLSEQAARNVCKEITEQVFPYLKRLLVQVS